MAQSARRSRTHCEQAYYLKSTDELGLRSLVDNEVLKAVITDYFAGNNPSQEIDTDSESESEDEAAPGTGMLSASSQEPDLSTEESMDSSDECDEEDYDVIQDWGPFLFRTYAPGLAPGQLCNCEKFNGDPCYKRFSPDDVQDSLLSYLSLTCDQLKLALLEQISNCINFDQETSSSQKLPKTRGLQRVTYHYQGYEICHHFFMYLHQTDETKLRKLIKDYKMSGLATALKSKKQGPQYPLSCPDNWYMYNFIRNFAEANAIILPGHVPWKMQCKLLPAKCSRRFVYKKYASAIEQTSAHKMGFITFNRFWYEWFPYVRCRKPRTDLCKYCHQGALNVKKNAGRSMEIQMLTLNEMKMHLDQVMKEHLLYTSVCEEARRDVPADASLGNNEPCSFHGKTHYSFNLAQQVHYPCDPQQPGPVLLKSPRKCGLFGVHAEGLKKQVNFLIDESCSEKAGSGVLSMIHYYFDHYGLGETEAILHADNCCKMTKINVMIQYLLWRVLTGRHYKITLSFVFTGHTKLTSDWCLGLFKRQFRNSKVNCLDDICKVVEQSIPEVSVPQLCVTPDGRAIVPFYDWATFLSSFFQKLPNLSKYNHFHFVSGSSVVKAQEFCDSAIEEFDLGQEQAPVLEPNDIPTEIQLPRMELKRKWYLFDEIRPFVEEDCKDLVAPRPDKELKGVNRGATTSVEPPTNSKTEKCESTTTTTPSDGIKYEEGKGKPRRRFIENKKMSDKLECRTENCDI